MRGVVLNRIMRGEKYICNEFLPRKSVKRKHIDFSGIGYLFHKDL